jgi:hypothetical protein
VVAGVTFTLASVGGEIPLVGPYVGP